MGKFPPDGANLSVVDTHDLQALCDALTGILCFLRDLPTSDPLLRYDDWLEHDGLLFPRGRVTFSALLELVRSPRGLLEATPEDHAVRVGIAPRDQSWYLRFRADLDSGGGSPEGSFDVTLPSPHDEYAAGRIATCSLKANRDSAREYYRRITKSR